MHDNINVWLVFTFGSELMKTAPITITAAMDTAVPADNLFFHPKYADNTGKMIKPMFRE